MQSCTKLKILNVLAEVPVDSEIQVAIGAIANNLDQAAINLFPNL